MVKIVDPTDEFPDDDDVFPIIEDHSDFSGKNISFKIECQDAAFGYLISAREIRNDNTPGYCFESFSLNNPFEALGKIELETGEIEILTTSLLDQEQFSVTVFSALYAKRWEMKRAISSSNAGLKSIVSAVKPSTRFSKTSLTQFEKLRTGKTLNFNTQIANKSLNDND